MNKTKRIPVITWLQAIGCVLVVFGHSYPFVTEYPRAVNTLQLFIYAFHMPLFVFCSGVLLVISEADRKYSFGAYLKRRGVRLLLPYFAFSLLGIVPKIVFSPLLNEKLSLDVVQILRAFLVPRQNIWGHFWFLPMIFLCAVVGYCLLRLMRRYPWTMAAALIVSLAGVFAPAVTGWLALNDLLHFGFYYILGMSVAALCERMRGIRPYRAYAIGLVLMVLAMVAFYLLGGEKGLSSKVQLATALLMLPSLYLMLLPISEKYPIKAISILNRSYSVFILSWPCQLVAEIVLERLLHLPWWCIIPPVFLAGVLVPCIIIKLVEFLERNRKHKILTRIIGG